MHQFTPLDETLLSVRSRIRQDVPGLKASHVAEALARSLGFGNNIALKAWMASVSFPTLRSPLADVFVARLLELDAGAIAKAGHETIVQAFSMATRDASCKESFGMLLRQAASTMVTDIWITLKPHMAIHLDGTLWNPPVGTDVAGMLAVCNEMGSPYHDATGIPGFPSTMHGFRTQSASNFAILHLSYKSPSELRGGGLANLGFNSRQRTVVDAILHTGGLVLVSGTTGSGKTTTMKALAHLKMQEVSGGSILSFESLPGNRERPTSLEDCLKGLNTAGRGGLDLVMVGEIRCREDALLAVTCHLHAHTALACIHANDAFSILGRMHDLGVGHEMKDAIRGLISQRLVRTLCTHCSVPFLDALATTDVDQESWEPCRELVVQTGGAETVKVVNRDGCIHCQGGYSGRRAIVETVEVDNRLINLVMRDKQAALRKWLLEQGGQTMMEVACAAMLAGQVDPLEVLRNVGLTSDLHYVQQVRRRG